MTPKKRKERKRNLEAVLPFDALSPNRVTLGRDVQWNGLILADRRMTATIFSHRHAVGPTKTT
jgi:hypothetical protein